MLNEFVTPELTNEDFELIRKLVGGLLGIKLNESKKTMVMSRLSGRLKALKIDSFKNYLGYIQSHQNGQDELVQFVNKITTNETYFFREEKHFEFLANTLAPFWNAQYAKDHNPIRIWSAACSSGEEPYSMVITLMEAMKKQNLKFDFKILASDINSEVLHMASSGIYRVEYLRKKVSNEFLNRYFLQIDNEQVQIKPELKKHIVFRRINLMSEKYPIKNKLDLIICRNVMIYFDNTTKDHVVSRFYEYVKDKSYLIIGHSENLFHFAEKFKSLGHTIYQKL